MTLEASPPLTLLETVTAGTERLFAAARGLTEAAAREPSLLPGWSRGHLLTHLARNADALVNVLAWARTGEEQRMYPSMAARESGIAAGAERPVGDLVADLEESAAGFAEAASELPPTDWDREVVVWRDMGPVPATSILLARLLEVEFHHVDLGVGYRFAASPGVAVDLALDFTVDRFARLGSVAPFTIAPTDRERTWTMGGADGGGWTVSVTGVAADLLGWVTGRGDHETVAAAGGGPLPALPPWG